MSIIALLLLTITLTWNDNSDNEDGFVVYRKSVGGVYSQIAIIPKETVYYIKPNVVQHIDGIADGIYCYQVAAYNVKGLSPLSNEACNNNSLTGVVTLAIK